MYYLTDTEIKFSINDNSYTIIIKTWNNKYIVYDCEIINYSETVKHESG